MNSSESEYIQSYLPETCFKKSRDIFFAFTSTNTDRQRKHKMKNAHGFNLMCVGWSNDGARRQGSAGLEAEKLENKRTERTNPRKSRNFAPLQFAVLPIAVKHFGISSMWSESTISFARFWNIAAWKTRFWRCPATTTNLIFLKKNKVLIILFVLFNWTLSYFRLFVSFYLVMPK